MWLLATPVALLLVAILVNLSWFDEPLLPEIEALRKPRSLAPEGNGYAFALGFLAAEGREPRAAGLELISVLEAHRDRGEPANFVGDEKRAILGMPPANDGLDAPLSFHCQARHRLDCADRQVAWIASQDLDQPRLALLFSRYESLLRQTHFGETPDADLQTPFPPLAPIVALGRLRLAKSFRTDSTAVFLQKASQDLAFWRMTLSEGQVMGMKMVALAAIRNTHDFLPALMRERDLDARDLELLRAFVRPLTREESDIGAAFVSGTRAYLLSDRPPETLATVWIGRLLQQKNATFNLEFREIIEPMLQRSSLGPREFFETKANEPLRHEMLYSPGVLYNLAGKLALSRSPWDPQQFPSRVHDEDGRISLILLQAEIEEHPALDVATLVRSSRHRNPYTGDSMEYDARAGTIGFMCLHTAFHPPELADHCAVALGRKTP